MNNIKMMSNSYLYSKANYDQPIITSLKTATRIDKKSPAFEGIIFDFKRRQTYAFLLDVLMNPNVILLHSPKPLSKSFVTFGCKDVGGDNKTKIFVDCSEMLKYTGDSYVCKNIDVFISVIIDAFVQLVYYSEFSRFTNNAQLVQSSTDCFVSLFGHILDYLSVNGYKENKSKIEYITALYFLCNEFCFDFNAQNTKNVAMKVAGLTPREANICDILLPKDDNHFMNIDVYIKHLESIFKMKGLTTELFTEKWLWNYGIGTAFATEFFPSFAAMVTDAYSGSYINNQKSIEKQCGRSMVAFSTAIFEVGKDIYKHI